MAVLVVDPGHGGSAMIGGSSPNNATGPHGTLEKTLTLRVGLLTRDALMAKGHKVVLTRNADTNLGLDARAAVARSASADAFVSIHFNGWNEPSVQGTETFVHREASQASLELARAVQAQALVATGLADRGVKKMNLGVLDPAKQSPSTAACLVEVSFITDPNEESRLADVSYLEHIAARLCDALDAYVTRPTASPEPPSQEDGFSALRAIETDEPFGKLQLAAAPSDVNEPQAWQTIAATVSMALGFWKDYFKLQSNQGDIDLVGTQRLTQILRAISWVESRHGTGSGSGQPARDPMQCGNPSNSWWRELTGQTDKLDFLACRNGPGSSLVRADKLAASASESAGFPPQASLDLLGDEDNGHTDSAFTPLHSFMWGIPYFLHRMNAVQGCYTYDCGDLSRDRLVAGAVRYNGGGDPKYRAKIDAALKLVGDLTPVVLAGLPAPPEAPMPLAETAASLVEGLSRAAPPGRYRVKLQLAPGGNTIESVEIEVGRDG
jgi:N-acetylmuramoyl-L-alanine amidase